MQLRLSPADYTRDFYLFPCRRYTHSFFFGTSRAELSSPRCVARDVLIAGRGDNIEAENFSRSIARKGIYLAIGVKVNKSTREYRVCVLYAETFFCVLRKVDLFCIYG